MEYVQAVLTSIEILKNIWSCNMGECLNYKRILDENIGTLKRKIEELRSREEDIDTELTKAQHLGGKKRKKEVETWLKNVRHKKREVHQHIEQKVGQRRYFSRLRFLRLVEKNTREVAELIEKGRFSGGLLIDVHEDQEAVLLATPLVGQSIEERNLSKIRECLKNDDVASIGVYGMGGIGKTTIVTHIHDELFQSPRTFDHVYWVTVSQESNIQKLQDNIAKVLGLTFSDPKDDIKRRAELMKDLAKKKRFVLFLDDMWKALSPEQVGIPVGVNAGKLVVTTRSLDVCRGMDCQHNIKVEPLLVEEAWDLFMEKLGRETRLTPRVEEIAKSISKECAGLPLAIITTARSMRGVHDIHEWRNALKELREPSKGLIDMESEVFKPLKFSYDRLNDETLQQCLLYCALFPEDHQIQREYLIMCWLSEGLINEMKTRQAEFDRGHSLLNKLENACLLERTTVGYGEICVKMHDVIRDMALNLTMVNPQFMVKAAVQLTELPNERDWSENLERVSLMKNDIGGQLSCISPKCPRLCTLMLQFNDGIKEIPNSLFEHMQNLRVLDLSQIHYIRCLPESISNLENIRALLLRDCSFLTYVPSLAKLTELRELDLKRTAIKKLPHGIENLVNLRRFDLSCTCTGEVFPSGVLLKLFHLQSLSIMHYMTDEHVDEIISLTQLEVLEICFHKMPMLNSYIKTQHWQRLSRYCLKTVGQPRPVFDDLYCRKVEWGDHHNLIGGDDPLVLPTNTQELVIYSCHDLRSLSDISSSLENARELERCWIECCRGLENLWSIPSLEEEFESCTYTDTSLLQSLRTLWLSLLNLSVLFNFKGVRVGGAPPRSGTFSNLKLFIVGQCWKLKYVFTRGLVQHHLQNLTVIHVYKCPEMENIIIADEEEKQREIVEAKEEDNNAIITCPNLRSLELYNLSKLESIWKGTLISHSLQQIRVRNCPTLKRLPLSLHLNDDPRTPPTQLALKKITGEQEWWDKLQWDHPDDKSFIQPLFDTKLISHLTDNFRAYELWKKDAEHYEK